ncbi:hypothetical protein [Marininema halotolerans]|nr:hypothetical protein [Marininema halotolerans]
MKCVSFDMENSLDRELYHFVNRNPEDFSDIVKNHLFTLAYGYQKSTGEEEEDPQEDIRNSGLPFA